MAKKKSRLDILMVQKGLVSSRSKAQALIGAGRVKVDGKIEDKAGHGFPEHVNIEISRPLHPYVSRGGMKLAEALKRFEVELSGMVCMDVGASTGGFTDCMIQNGASRVYAIDVGYGQLDWSLRNNPDVIMLERTNIRYLAPAAVPEQVDFASIDTSFISLKLVIPAVVPFLKPGGKIIALIKPQFEVGRKYVGKKGIVRDPALHEKVIKELESFFSDLGLENSGVIQSPVKGARGNVEFLIFLKKPSLPED